ncbi:MAG: DNA replication/repair protein RecF [Anaerolineae bacterium]
MHVRSLSLRHFRTYSRLELDFPAAPILLLGANAQGKTSLLEAIAYLALGSSPLTNNDRHLIHWAAVDSGLPFAQVEAEVVKRKGTERLEIALQLSRNANGQTHLSKRVHIDERSVRVSDLAGHLNVVLFLPQDVQLIGGPPADRRRHLDALLSQVYPKYVEAHRTYHSALSRRNALLRYLRDEGGDPAQLEPLEALLAKTGVTISLYRRQVVAALSLHADRFHQELTGGAAWLQLKYEPDFDPLTPPALDYQLGLLPQEEPVPPVDVAKLRDAFRRQLVQNRPQAIQRGITRLGPQRDELRFLSQEIDLGTFGSRGQQRSAVLALRLAELRWLKEETGEAPVLLLDEVLAELDQERRTYLLKLLDQVEQTILATTDAEMFPRAFREHTLTLRVADGVITPA